MIPETNENADKWTAVLLGDATHWSKSGEDLGDGGVTGSTVSLPT